jgi:hypothetical protein
MQEAASHAAAGAIITPLPKRQHEPWVQAQDGASRGPLSILQNHGAGRDP